jgi:hypothetical protein
MEFLVNKIKFPHCRRDRSLKYCFSISCGGKEGQSSVMSLEMV